MNQKILSGMKYKLLISLLFALGCLQSHAQLFEETTIVNRAFGAGGIQQLLVGNKYGDVQVDFWEKDSVKIVITKTISEKNESRFNKMKENVAVSVELVNGGVEARTLFGAKYTTVVKEVQEATNNFDAANNKSHIDYRVWVPRTVKLDITNKYGNVILSSAVDEVRVNLSNGDLQADKIGVLSGSLAFGSAIIQSVDSANLTTNFVKLSVSEIKSVVLNSRSSDIRVASVGSMSINSRRDEIEIQRMNKMSGETYFSVVDVASADECRLKVSYGEIKHLSMSPRFSALTLNCLTCKANVELLSPVAYNMLLKSSSSQVSLPQSLVAQSAASQSDPVLYVFQKKLGSAAVKVNLVQSHFSLNHK